MVRASTGSDSKQDYQTPPDFIEAFELRFGKISFDLAAHKNNTQHEKYFCAPELRWEEPDAYGVDSFAHDWAELSYTLEAGTCMWLNCEFSDIDPWAYKCRMDAPRFKPGVRLGLLTPASVGARWFIDNVYQKGYTLILDGRLTFVGAKDPFPKDCQVTVYSGDRIIGWENWDWRNERRRRTIDTLKV